MNRPAVGHYRAGRKQRTRGLVHERHELVRKTRHRAPDADTPDIWASANSVHPSTLSDVALHHGAPASQLHNAGGRSIFIGELGLLVVSSAVASLVNS